jgi:hypothetical protein
MTDLAKKIIQAAIFTLILLFGSVAMPESTAQAQGRHGGGHWRGGGGVVYRSPRVFVAPRYYRYPRAYYGSRYYGYPYYYSPYYYPYGAFSFGYYGYSMPYDAGPNDVAESKGYHDGYDRGNEDARDGKRYDPNNSSHYRQSMRSAYREGFRRGYDDGYRGREG